MSLVRNVSCVSTIFFFLRCALLRIDVNEMMSRKKKQIAVTFPPADVMQLTCQHKVTSSDVDVMQSPFSLTLRLSNCSPSRDLKIISTTSFQFIIKHESFYHYQQLKLHLLMLFRCLFVCVQCSTFPHA